MFYCIWSFPCLKNHRDSYAHSISMCPIIHIVENSANVFSQTKLPIVQTFPVNIGHSGMQMHRQNFCRSRTVYAYHYLVTYSNTYLIRMFTIVFRIVRQITRVFCSFLKFETIIIVNKWKIAFIYNKLQICENILHNRVKLKLNQQWVGRKTCHRSFRWLNISE